MILQNTSRLSYAFMAILLVSGMLMAFSAQAQANECRVRADVTSNQVETLSGGSQTGDRTAGTTLPVGDDPDAGDNALICTFSLLLWLTNILFVIIIAVAILLFAYAAFLFVTAGENANKRNKAKMFLIWAIVGLVIASLARLIPGIAMSLLVTS
ncbi:MAG: hypothetical protein WDZ39_00190 [Candidatus Spechtbacterales bacterium]